MSDDRATALGCLLIGLFALLLLVVGASMVNSPAPDCEIVVTC